MYLEKLTLKGVTYHFQKHYVKKVKLWLCVYVSDNGEILRGYIGVIASVSESLLDAASKVAGMATSDFKDDILGDTCPSWSELYEGGKRRISMEGSKLKSFEISKWHTEVEDYSNWCKKLTNITGLKFS